MLRILFFLMAVVAAVRASAMIVQPQHGDVSITPPTDGLPLELHPRQSGLPSSSGAPSGPGGWFRPSSSLSEVMSVLFPSSSLNPIICETTNDDLFETGLCLRYTDCIYRGGESFGSCGSGIGNCCVFSKKCDSTTNMFVSHFVNPTFSSVDTGSGECKLTINPMNSNICQYRLDFENFSILGPDQSSNCVDDFFGVTGGSPVPKMCGDMSGQHVYVNVKPAGGPIVLTMDTSSVKTMARKWNIKVTQISCNDPSRAPTGCLQFFNETSGSVRSFNFMRKSAPEQDDFRQIQNLNYGVCINSKVGYCDVTWTQSSSNDYTFTVSGDATVGDGDLLTSKVGIKDCTSDFVTIPGGKYVDLITKEEIPAERFCGTKFPEVITAAQPYIMHVVTDANEEDDMGNLGFELNFRQNLCYS